MEFSSNGDVEQNNGGAADWQEVMQGVKFQGTFKNFLSEKFGFLKKSPGGILNALGKHGLSLLNIEKKNPSDGTDKVKIPGLEDTNKEVVNPSVMESLSEIFQNDYTREVVGQMVDEDIKLPTWNMRRISEKLDSNEGGWFEKENDEKRDERISVNLNLG
jgi:hypothetical protein